MNDDELMHALTVRFAKQVNDLTALGVPPIYVANLLIDLGTAAALMTVDRSDVADALREGVALAPLPRFLEPRRRRALRVRG